MPRLSDMLGQTLNHALPGDPEIAGLTADSRAVKPGDLFAALPGGSADGRSFIEDAIARGAVAVLAPAGTVLEDKRAVLVTDDNPRRRFALMAAKFFGRQPATMVAVTGTNGKTSVANFTRQIWSLLELPAASFGTVGLVSPQRNEAGTLTTPDPVALHRLLAELADEGVTHAAFEASSHGLDQYRLDGVSLSAAAFTNLTRDHLDYHGDMDGYWQAKRRLFAELLPDWGTVVVNADTEQAEDIKALAQGRGQRVIGFGTVGEDIRILKVAPAAAGQEISLSVLGRRYDLLLPLAGDFQVFNAACALGLVIATGGDVHLATLALEKLQGVPGRLQLVAQNARGAAIYVDYAHTPDGLETALRALKPHTKGRLIALFGCGGDRDPGKRPMMGAIAARLSDYAIVTDDNPRTEDAADIRAQVMVGCPNAEEIGDRRSAIRAAVAMAEEGDVVVLAGKGHESGQIVGSTVLPFDDADEARKAVEGGA
ncbi:MAG TPA: UDP-N-acetylmuramoyl-L-alanyl-D-glutamate--2,6-diaminopimelate ligase [Magnetospirillaceae bacterium]|nr:UDP-N-acetylmuramoyl-L-alanyl-D-glutamate--2,6-diaminopimelate ligase [Magnetospirillaceae bacterium]